MITSSNLGYPFSLQTCEAHQAVQRTRNRNPQLLLLLDIEKPAQSTRAPAGHATLQPLSGWIPIHSLLTVMKRQNQPTNPVGEKTDQKITQKTHQLTSLPSLSNTKQKKKQEKKQEKRKTAKSSPTSSPRRSREGSRLRKPPEIPRQRGGVRQRLLLRWSVVGGLEPATSRSGEQPGPALPPLSHLAHSRRGELVRRLVLDLLMKGGWLVGGCWRGSGR